MKNQKIKIDGVEYENPFCYNIYNNISKLFTSEFTYIHGDTTFSNILIDSDYNSHFIDPRGVFGKTLIYGDKNYDWAKLFYSVNGNYDSINSKKFTVNIMDDEVILDIKSNDFEKYSDMVIEASGMEKNKMYLHQALIWFSLTGYVKEDIDAILYSFYNGIKLWNLSTD